MGNLIMGHQIVDGILKALPSFADALAEAERWLTCRDQVKQLTVAVENVLTQAHRVLAQALLDYRIASEYALKQQTVDLVVNASILIFGGRLPLPSKRTSRTPRLGKVVIAVGPGGLPEDLMVVNVSELAGQEGKTDVEIEDAFADKGQVLVTVEEFKRLATWLGEEVQSGRSTLPYHPAKPIPARPLRLRIRR